MIVCPLARLYPCLIKPILKTSRLEQEVLFVSNMAKRPAMHAPAPKGEKAPRRAPKVRASEETTVRYLSGYVSKSGGIQDSHARKIDQIEKLLCQARELACLLLAVRYGATQPACEHTVVKRYPSGMRDNGEYDLVCTRYGKNF